MSAHSNVPAHIQRSEGYPQMSDWIVVTPAARVSPVKVPAAAGTVIVMGVEPSKANPVDSITAARQIWWLFSITG